MYEFHHGLTANMAGVVPFRREITPSPKSTMALLIENQLHQRGFLGYYTSNN